MDDFGAERRPLWQRRPSGSGDPGSAVRGLAQDTVASFCFPGLER
jgi:hypothetical protein